MKNNSGLSLLELVVVLAILAALATIAVTATSGWVDQSRYEQTRTTLGNVREATLGPEYAREPDGTLIFTGFVADMGRLPRSTGSAPFTLDELWNAIPNFDVRQSTSTNTTPSTDADGEVSVPCGWRGPYLRLPVGSNQLTDGWGVALESPAAGYDHLRDAADSPISASGQTIYIIRSLGADNATGGSDYNTDQTISLSNLDIQASFSGEVRVSDGSGGFIAPSDTEVKVKVFGPDPSVNGGILLVSANVIFSGTTVGTYSIGLSDGVTIGPRIIRAYYTGSSSTKTKSPVTSIMVRPGANIRNLTVDR
jgi:prepilin-type N-terminal cleavage/methylation domain-containing protein